MEQKFRKPETRQIIYVILFALTFIIFWKTLNHRSAEYYHLGENALEEGKTLQAIAFFERSALYYTPNNPYTEESAKRLAEIAKANGENLFGNLSHHAIKRIEKQIYPSSITQPAEKGDIKNDLPGGLTIPHRLAIHASFVLWIAGIFWIFRKGFTSTGEINVKEATNGLFTFLISLFVWLFLLAA